MASRRLLSVLAVVVAVSWGAPAAHACRVLEITFTPARDPQLVVWIEDASGNFADTIFVTAATGTYGLANRPGRFDFNSDWHWPYGRRETVFPVWSHRRGITYPRLIFRDEQDDDLSHPLNESSPEPFYCQPLCREGSNCTWNAVLDAGTCATPLGLGPYTDKGMFERAADGGILFTSYYPPRADATRIDFLDHPDVGTYADYNDLDAISRATPPAGMPFTIRYAVPPTLPNGTYTVWIEASAEFDQNSFYDFPPPPGISFSNYGLPYRGQPSVLWAVPISVGDQPDSGQTLDYEGYGDPDGITGDLFPPDGTITTDVEGSGAGRLVMASSADGAYRLLVNSSETGDDLGPPAAPGGLRALEIAPQQAVLGFIEPGDDGMVGPVTSYEIRTMAGVPLDESNFQEGQLLADIPTPIAPGMERTFTFAGLNPDTHYWLGVRAHDDCAHAGPLALVDFVTPRATGAEVSACFVATAAYGSPMAANVAVLRGLRDRVLKNFVLGELFVETYYTVGPALAEVIRPSDTLRALTRDALVPFVALARRL